MEFQINEREISSEFDRISKLLLFEKRLNVNAITARFTEIEFYYYCQQHDDGFTHEHGLDAGRWRFHNQGFDITLKGSSGFGGVLIRGVEIDGEYINGPRRVLFKLMSFLNPVGEMNNTFGLIGGEKLNQTIFKTYRQGLGSPSDTLTCHNPDYFLRADYRYIVSPKKFNKKQFTGAEQIARGFNNDKLAIEFLGYSLNK